jgi:hypothetical protein
MLKLVGTLYPAELGMVAGIYTALGVGYLKCQLADYALTILDSLLCLRISFRIVFGVFTTVSRCGRSWH